MKKKGKSFSVTPPYKQRVPSTLKTNYQSPPKWFKVVKVISIVLLWILCLWVIIIIIGHFVTKHL